MRAGNELYFEKAQLLFLMKSYTGVRVTEISLRKTLQVEQPFGTFTSLPVDFLTDACFEKSAWMDVCL